MKFKHHAYLAGLTLTISCSLLAAENYYDSPLLPGTKVVAGDPSKNEFFLLASNDEASLHEVIEEDKSAATLKLIPVTQQVKQANQPTQAQKLKLKRILAHKIKQAFFRDIQLVLAAANGNDLSPNYVKNKTQSPAFITQALNSKPKKLFPLNTVTVLHSFKSQGKKKLDAKQLTKPKTQSANKRVSTQVVAIPKTEITYATLRLKPYDIT